MVVDLILSMFVELCNSEMGADN